MARLRIYTVHINPSLSYPFETAEFVKEGFNWKAFFFTSLWALYSRLWWQAGALVAYNVAVLMMWDSHILSHIGLCVIDLAVHLVIGFEANEWLRARLKHKGYLTSDIATGDSLLRAEQRYYDRYFAAQSGVSA